MARMSKEELKNSIDGYDISDDIKISLLENIEDSMDVADTTEVDALTTERDTLKAELEDYKKKYKERFLGIVEDTIETIADVVDEGLQEEEVIDVKEL